jgi:alpha-L-fucosidase
MPERFSATWDSLKQYQIPAWYQDAKFGIFIHWGVYSVPAFGNEWYPRQMYLQGTPEYEHHLKTYGPHKQFGYKDFIPQFKAERFDAQAWAALFAEAGARFVVPVAEHHDGFAMYDTALSPWNAARMGPKRDIIAELGSAVKNKGMVFGVSSHRAEHWWFMNGGREFDSDLLDPATTDFYGPAIATANSKVNDGSEWKSRDWTPRPDAAYLEDWLARCCELVDKYQPQLFWFDWWIEQIVFQPYMQRFAAYYYNRGQDWDKGVAINYKNQTFPLEAAVWDIERGQLSGLRQPFWQTDTSVSKNSWGYIQNHDYKQAADIIQDLVDIVSKNGALLLNIGPRPDGMIPEPEQAILREIGAWLRVNGEAIFGTRPWTTYGEGPTEVADGGFTDTQRTAYTGQDLRFTKAGNNLYVTALAWPGSRMLVKSLASDKFFPFKIRQVSLLGQTGSLSWRQDPSGLSIELPASASCATPVLKIECTAEV